MVKTVRVVNEKEEERNEEFTRKIIEDYFLILKDGRIVGSRRSSDNDGSFTIIFEVMGINCNTDNDLGRSKPFSLQDLDPDLYLTEEELDVIMRTVPNKNHTILASPIFMKNEISRIIAFQPTDKNDREDMYLLFVHAPYLIQRFSESFIHEGKQSIGAAGGLKYGQSLTDGCIGWDETVKLIGQLAESIQTRGV